MNARYSRLVACIVAAALAPVLPAAASAPVAAPQAAVATARTARDFNLDGRTDLLWRHATTGQVYLMPMGASGPQAGAVVWTEADPAWQIIAAQDLDGDGNLDLLWRNTASGTLYAQYLNGGATRGGAVLYQEPNLDWQVQAVADFNGDGRADILFRHATSGMVYLLPLGPSGPLQGSVVWTEADPAWRIVGTGDFNGDGTADLLWRNSATGLVYAMTFSGGAVSGGQVIHSEPDAHWRIIALADVDGDGLTDLVWRHDTSGAVYVMPLKAGLPSGGDVVWTEGDPAWQIEGVGDFDGDGKADLLYRNSSNGMLFRILLDGASVKAASLVYQEANLAWSLQVPGLVKAAAAPVQPVITGPSVAAPGQAGLAASVPDQAGCTFSWTVSGGTLASGAGTRAVTFSAGGAGTLVLGCTATNADGLSATGSLSVPVAALPAIASFTAAPALVTQGHASILSWQTSGASSLSVAPGVGVVTGQTTANVAPAATTTYTLTAADGYGRQATAPATVTVVAPAVITSFTASATTVTAGASVTLKGVFTGTGAIAGVGAVTSGVAVTVNPTATTTYVLSATNAAGDAVTSSVTVTVSAAQKRVLFDHTKHEEAGSSAYWIICSASEPDPTPANPTKESDWNGGISAWAFDFYQAGWKVQSLPSTGRITYGDATNAQDLSNYSVYIIPECYIKFTAAEKAAIYNYVANGGGLFIVANHVGASRYSGTGGTDAFTVFNDLVSYNVAANTSWTGFNFVAGHAFDTSGYRNMTTTAFSTATGKGEDAIIRGSYGTLAAMDFHDYSYVNVNTAWNPTVREILHTGVPGETGSMAAFSYVGLGRVVAISDSSPTDDGTATGHSLYDGWTSNSNRAFFMNACMWLANGGTSN